MQTGEEMKTMHIEELNHMPNCLVLYDSDTCVGMASYSALIAVDIESEEVLCVKEEVVGSFENSNCLTKLNNGKRLALSSDENIVILNVENKDVVSARTLKCFFFRLYKGRIFVLPPEIDDYAKDGGPEEV